MEIGKNIVSFFKDLTSISSPPKISDAPLSSTYLPNVKNIVQKRETPFSGDKAGVQNKVSSALEEQQKIESEKQTNTANPAPRKETLKPEDGTEVVWKFPSGRTNEKRISVQIGAKEKVKEASNKEEPQKSAEGTEISPKERWKQTIEKLKPISGGTLHRDAKVLATPYWKEALGMKLKIEGPDGEVKTYTGHAKPSKLLDKYFKNWSNPQNKDSESKRPYYEIYSFEKYMNERIIPKASESVKKELIENLSSEVEYYSPEELSHLQVSFDENGIAYTKDSTLTNWAGYLDKRPEISEDDEEPPASLSYRTFCESNPDVTTSEKVQVPDADIDPYGYDHKNYMFVLDKDDNLYIQRKQEGKAHHSSLGGGEAAIAGSLTITDGKITGLSDESGHYQPSTAQIIHTLETLEKKGVDISSNNFSLSITGIKQPKTYIGQEVKTWMNNQKQELIAKMQKIAPTLSEKSAKEMSYSSLENMYKKLYARTKRDEIPS